MCFEERKIPQERVQVGSRGPVFLCKHGSRLQFREGTPDFGVFRFEPG